MNKKTIILAIVGLIIIAGVGIYFGFLKTPPRLVDGGTAPVFTYKVGESPTNAVLYNDCLYSFQGYEAQVLIFDRIDLGSQTNHPITFAYPRELGRLNMVLPPDLVIVEDVVYIMLHAQQMVLIYNLEGQLQNAWQMPNITTTSELAVGPEGIYLLVPQKRVVIMLDQDGNERGRIPVDKGTVRLIVKDDIYVGNLLGFIVRYSLTGEELERTELNLRYMYNFAFDDEKLYIAYTDDTEGKNHLRVAKRDGKGIKTYALPYVVTGLLMAEGKLYISDENRQEVLVYALK